MVLITKETEEKTESDNIMEKRYSSFINSAGKMVLCDSEGYAIREMTEKEIQKFYEYSGIFGYVPFSDEELEKGAEEIKEKEKNRVRNVEQL